MRSFLIRRFSTALVLSVFCFAPAQAQQGKLVFADTTHSFGVIPEGEEATHVFNFRNEGNAPLQLTRVVASCGCTTPEWTRDPIAPGATGSIKVVYHSEGHPGVFTRNVNVWSDGEPGYAQLFIDGKVRARPMENPIVAGNLHFNLTSVDMGAMEPNLYAVQTFQVQNSSSKLIRIIDARLPVAQGVSVEFPTAALETMDLANVTVFVDTKTVKPGESFDYTITLVTDDEVQPEKQIQVKGSVAPVN
jgi:hypothetical protein